jgi:hypothetical protein
MASNEETLKVAPKASAFYLVYSLPERATVRVALELDAEVVFGRSDAGDVDVAIDDPRVSRRHAVVRRATGGVTVRDLGSSNGTVVRGEPLRSEERRVGAGDVFEIGPMQILVATASARLVVADPAVRKLHAAGQRVARRSTPVLLLGEPGVGKAALAEQIHDWSARAEKPYVVFHCGAVPESRVEAELFGERGRPGFVDKAHPGTLFLADIELLPPAGQRRLLQLLTIQPGKKTHASVDVRLLASSTGDLRAAVDTGHFDAKLYALVATLAMRIPPLRERKTEIPVLADHLLRRIAEPLGLPAPSVTPEAARLLCEFPWPRNVSDLRDVVEYALALSDDGRIGPGELPASFLALGAPSPREAQPTDTDGRTVVLRIAREGHAFRLPPAPEISLARRGPLRRILLRLALHRDGKEREALSGDDLLAAGWPGEKPVGQSAEGRVRTAVWMLRRMGLHDRLVTTDDGYRLGAEVEIDWY